MKMRKALMATVAAAAMAIAQAPLRAVAASPGSLAKLMKMGSDDLAQFFGSAAAKQGDDALEGLIKLNDETTAYIQTMVKRAGHESLEEGWNVIFVALRSSDQRLPANTGEVVKGVMSKVRQMQASARLAEDPVAARRLIQSFSAEEKKLMELYAERVRKVQTVRKAPDHRIMSVDENLAANALLLKLKQNGDLVDGEVAEIAAAIKAGDRGSAFQRELAALAQRQKPDQFKPAAVPDLPTNTASKAVDDAAEAADGAVAKAADDAAEKADDAVAKADDATKAAPTSLKAAGALFEDGTEFQLRAALSQARYESPKLFDLPPGAEGLYKMTTTELLGKSKELLEGGGRVGAGLRDVAKAVKSKAAAKRSPAEQAFLTAYNKRFEHGGFFLTPSGLVMGARESDQAVKFLKTLKTDKRVTDHMREWKTWQHGNTEPIPLSGMHSVFSKTEVSWLDQAAFANYDTPFLQEVRRLTHPKMREAANGVRNPFPRAGDIEAATPVLADRMSWQSALIGEAEQGERIARLNNQQIGGSNSYMVTDLQGEARQKLLQTVRTEMKQNPTAEAWARKLDPSESAIETLNPLPSAADVAHYAEAWTKRVNSLEDQLRKARVELAENLQGKIKGEVDAKVGTARASAGVGHRVQRQGSLAYDGPYASSRGTVRILEDQLVALRAIAPEHYATRFPPLGKMDEFIDAVKASLKHTEEFGAAVKAEADEAFKQYSTVLDRARMSTLAGTQDSWVNPATGVTEYPRKMIDAARARLESLVNEIDSVAAKAKSAGKGGIGRAPVSSSDPLGARRAKEVAMAREQALADMRGQVRAITSKTSDEWQETAKAFNKHKDDFIADSQQSLATMRADLRTRLNDIRRELPQLEHKANLLKRDPNAADEYEKLAAQVRKMQKDKEAIMKAGENIDDRITKEHFDGRSTPEYTDTKNKMSFVNRIYGDVVKVLEQVDP